jgi:hypothetical protein
MPRGGPGASRTAAARLFRTPGPPRAAVRRPILHESLKNLILFKLEIVPRKSRAAKAESILSKGSNMAKTVESTP